MIKIRGIFKAGKMNVWAEKQGQSYIKSKLQFFFHLVYVVL